MSDNAASKDLARDGRSALGRCPRCGASVIETTERYACEKSLAQVGPCTFRLGKIVISQPLDCRQVTLLLTSGRTDLLHQFVSKSGRTFSARLTIGDTGKVVFEFPPSPAQVASEPAQQDPPERIAPEQPCTTLLNTATRKIFTQNAFRVTGLTVDATTREIAKQTEKLKMMHELGQAAASHQHAFPLNPPPTMHQIRDAIDQLKDPERRIIDEFFWFWPKELGQGRSDPAIQALASGDSQAALNQWQAQSEDSQGVVARHNLAVFWHLTALEWENKSLNGGVDTATLRDIHSYWKQAFQQWDQLLSDDDLWDILTHRIRQIDDPRLTSGFARRIRVTLPQAFDKINAELAIAYAHAGKRELARFHIDFMRKTNQGLDDIESTTELVLSPARKQLREHISAAKHTADDHPVNANEAGHALLRSAQPLLELFDLFHGKGHVTRDDIFDEVATICMQCAVAHQRATSNNKAFVSLLSDILPLAASEDLRQRVQKNISIGRGNLAHACFQPFRDSVREIQSSKEPLRTRILRLQMDIVPRLRALQSTSAEEKEALNDCFSDVAWTFRKFSVDAHNQDGDTETALELINLASQFAGDAELQKQIAEDVKQLAQIKRNQDSHNLLLNIRDDRIEVTRAGLAYNNQFVTTTDISAIRFGVGVFDLYCHIDFYTLGIRGQQANEINIDFKKVLRSKEQARKDLSAVLDSLAYHIIPKLTDRIAANIAAGRPEQLGDCWLTSPGIRATVSSIFSTEEVLIPWTDVRFGTQQGNLHLRSSQNKKFSKSYSLRTAWNAVIFEEIVKVVTKSDR